MSRKFDRVFITGGAGYVGAVLVPKLLKQGYEVTVLDLFLYGEDVFDEIQGEDNLTLIKGDLRDAALMDRALENQEVVIHLACISNDPSFELNPELGKSINYDAFVSLVELSKKHKVKRFIYASSSSVYGVKEVSDVTEDLELEPLTDYSKYKALCEKYLHEKAKDAFTYLILRPATVCGYSPRQRLDLTVNILTNHAINKKAIKVFGGKQKRPNIHIEDMTDLYVQCLLFDDGRIHGKVFNAGYENYAVEDIAKMVKTTLKDPDLQVVYEQTDDNRSYHISSKKIEEELGFIPRHTVENAIEDLKKAFEAGKLPNAFENIRYYNIKTMQAVGLK